MVSRTRALGVALISLTALAVVSPASSLAQDPADQPPFGGDEVPRRVPLPPRFDAYDLSDTASHADGVSETLDQLDREGGFTERFYTRGDDYEVVYRNRDHQTKAIVVIDRHTKKVVGAFTGEAVDTKLARGYAGAVAGKANSWWIWLPLCALFLAPFLDPKRPFRLLHLDLVVLLGLSVSLFFFNRAEITASSLLVYPVLGYVFARMMLAGFGRGPGASGPLLPWAPRTWLVAGIAALAIFHVGYQATEGKVIDVGIAGVIGADRLTSGDDVYSEDFDEGLPESGDVRGDVYGPVNYLSYAPFELALPWSGEWDDVPAAQAASVAFTLLTALALFGLGRRLREEDDGTTLGVALAFAWLAYPFTLYTAASSFNDSLVALLVVCALLAAASAPARGTLAALAGLTKFGPLALGPLLAAGTGDRRPKQVALFVGAFAVVALVVTIPLIPDGGLREMYDRSLGYQASRGSPFSVWGQAPGLEPLHTATKVFAVGLACALFFVPRTRTLAQLAALSAAVLVAVEVTAGHWFYPYAVWFAPLFLASVFSAQATGKGLQSAIKSA